MVYDKRSLAKIKEKFGKLSTIRKRLVFRIMEILEFFKNERAREYLIQGVGRRLNILTRCIDNIFCIFPIDRTTHLTREELSDIGINLHAFFVNIAGLLDNLAWVVVHEKGLLGDGKDGTLGQLEVSLFKDKAQQHLPESFRTYLKSERITRWYSGYTKNYRDTLAHRIPLYVPPAVLTDEERDQYLSIEAEMQALDVTESSHQVLYNRLLASQQGLGQPSPFFAHSMNEGCRPVFLHAQIIADYLTLEEIVDMFCDNWQ